MSDINNFQLIDFEINKKNISKNEKTKISIQFESILGLKINKITNF